ncbi:MAG: outer membrane protein assembly factor BamA [Planctomycetes bacterium]|nr:outer membrane protein assembly factor BamA [Planctomycetota bacterium]
MPRGHSMRDRRGKLLPPLRTVHIFAALMLLVGSSLLMAQDPGPSTIEEIRLQGLDRLGTAEVLARMKIRVGDPWNAEELDAEYRRLWASGDFISIDSPKIDRTPNGIIITIRLMERKPIHEIVFEGTDSLSDKVAQKSIRSQKEQLYDPLLVREDVTALRNLLLEKGHPFARVGSRIEKSEDGLLVVFEIEEGPEVLLRSIDLKGEGSIPTDEILPRLKLRTRSFLGLMENGKFDPRLLDEDLEKIREYYVVKGFFDAEVTLDRMEFGADLKDLRLVIEIEEGPRYRIGKVEFKFDGKPLFDESILRDTLQIGAGEAWDGEIVKDDSDRLRLLYSDRAYIDAVVNPSVIYPLEGEDVILRYQITEGNRVFADEIEFRGNAATKDSVIRRQLEIFPGEELYPDRIQDSLSSLYRLQYFQQIRPFFDSSDEPEQRPVVFEVMEGTTGRALFGVGYSSGRGVVGNLHLEKRNFDITDWPDSLTDLPGSFSGAGQRLILEAQPGTEYSRYRVLFQEPYLMGSQNSLRLAAYRSVLLRQDYIEDRNSGAISLGRLFSQEKKLRGEIGFRREKISVEEVSDLAPSVVVQSAGKTRLNAIDLEFDWDQRTYRPVIGAVDGWYLEGGFSHTGGPIGGELDLLKLNLGTGWFKTISQDIEEMRHILAFRTSLGWVEPFGDTDFVPVFERYYLGGPRSLRGFDYRGAGPREDDREIGGTIRHRGSLEYTWPMLDNTLRGIVFTDFGNLAEDKASFSLDDYRVGVGGGVILNVPIFGQPLPISITWTEAVKSQEGDRLQEFSFDLGWFLY